MDSPPPAPVATRASRAPWYRRVEVLLWIALIATVVGLRYPMLKGWWYRSTDRTPPPASFEWRTDYEAALAEARATGRPVFADFHASWCPPCIAMKHDVWPDPEVGRQLTARYVPLSIDVDEDPRTASRYNVRGIPTILVLDANGSVLREASFMSRGGILKFLDEHD